MDVSTGILCLHAEGMNIHAQTIRQDTAGTTSLKSESALLGRPKRQRSIARPMRRSCKPQTVGSNPTVGSSERMGYEGGALWCSHAQRAEDLSVGDDGTPVGGIVRTECSGECGRPGSLSCATKRSGSWT